MPLSGYFIDANLLVLFVVGRASPDLIAKHRRLSDYSVEDYYILLNKLKSVERVLVTPNTLTEASNLLAYHTEPELSLLFDALRNIIRDCVEVVVKSEVASSRSEFNRLGLTDSALLEVVSEDTPLITVDVDLYLAALQEGQNSALNFAHIRNL